MRRLVVLLVLLAGTASAQERPRPGASLRVEGYADDDSTLVLRPHLSGRVAVDEWIVGGTYGADVVSSASIDVVTRASRPIEEARHQIDVDAGWYGERAGNLAAGYTLALEPDFETHGLTLRGGVDLDDERMWHGSTSLAFAFNRIRAVVDPTFERESATAQLGLALARILGPGTLARATLEGSVTGGFQASAYRNVRLGNWQGMPYVGDDPAAGPWVFRGVSGVARERHPELRLRARAGVELAQDLGSMLALVARAAFYGDDWGIVAGDLSAELRWEPERALLFRAGLRGYVQHHAWFWRQRYASPDETQGFVTDDKELGPMRSYTLTLAAAIPIDPSVRLDVRADGTRYEYPGFTLLFDKHALAVQIGVVWTP